MWRVHSIRHRSEEAEEWQWGPFQDADKQTQVAFIILDGGWPKLAGTAVNCSQGVLNGNIKCCIWEKFLSDGICSFKDQKPFERVESGEAGFIKCNANVFNNKSVTPDDDDDDGGSGDSDGTDSMNSEGNSVMCIDHWSLISS